MSRPCRYHGRAPVAQLDRASDYESEGRTFESFRARHLFLRDNKDLSYLRRVTDRDGVLQLHYLKSLGFPPFPFWFRRLHATQLRHETAS